MLVPSLSFRFSGSLKLLIVLGVVVWGMVSNPNASHAHRIIVFAWAESETVFVESKFSNGKKVNQGDVTVRRTEQDILLTGKTDDQGRFSFQVSQPESLIIEVKGGPEHLGIWHMAIEDWEGQSFPEASSELADFTTLTTSSSSEKPLCLDEAQLRNIINEELDKKTRPILRTIGAITESRPNFQDILGGFGYVLGLVGLGAYLHYRKKLKD